MGKTIKIGLIVVMLVAMSTVTVEAQDIIRSIDPKEALPGQVVTVELTATQNLGSPTFGEIVYLFENFPGSYVDGSERCITGCDGVEYNESIDAFVVVDLTPQDGFTVAYSISAPTISQTYYFNGSYQEFYTGATGNITGDDNITVTSTINVTTNVTEISWGFNQSIEISVTTPSGYPVVNATVSLIGAQTKHTYAEDVTGPNGTVVFTIRPSPLDEGKGGLIVYANYTYDNKTITNQTTIDVIAPANITYIYATARIEGTTNVLANKRIEVTYRVDSITAPLNYYGVLPNNTTDRGEFLLKFPTPNIGEQHDYYIYLTPVPSTEQKGKYVNVEYHTVIPGYVRITYGTTSVQANVPVRTTVYVLYPNNTVVQVFDDLTNTWSQHRSLDTTPKRADGVSKFKVKMQVMLGDKPYNLSDLEQALSGLGIDMTLPKEVYICVNDTNIAVMDSNGQACDYIPLNLDNSTAIFYVRSNAPTDPSELRPENTGIINITGWYNYTIIPGTQSKNNISNVVNLTDYDYADFEGTGYIAGEVLDGETMRSIAGATVYVKWFNGTTWVNATDFEGKPIITTTDEYGHYKLEVISGEIYRVYAEKVGYVGCAPSTDVAVELGKTSTADVVLIKEEEINPDPVPDDLEQLVTKYNPSFDWKTDTPTKDDVFEAVKNAVSSYFNTTDTAERQQIFNDVVSLVNLYFEL